MYIGFPQGFVSVTRQLDENETGILMKLVSSVANEDRSTKRTRCRVIISRMSSLL